MILRTVLKGDTVKTTIPHKTVVFLNSFDDDVHRKVMLEDLNRLFKAHDRHMGLFKKPIVKIVKR